MKEVEIICIDCKKKEMRKTKCSRCFACAVKKSASYCKPKNKVMKICKECKSKYTSLESKIEFCSSYCKEINRNKEINSNWSERKLEHKYKRKAINEFNCKITPTMLVVEDEIRYSRKPHSSKKSKTL
jgi:hypothetical protein